MVMVFGAASLASTCSCNEPFSFEQEVPEELTANAEGVEKTITVRANAEVFGVNLTVTNAVASPAPVQVELPDAVDVAPVRIPPARSGTIALCTPSACGEHFRVILRSLGEPVTVKIATKIEGLADCGSLRVGATID